MWNVRDKNFKKIKRGQYVQYNSENYKVSFAVPGKLILTDGVKHYTLTNHSQHNKDKFNNIEVVFDKDEAKRMQAVV